MNKYSMRLSTLIVLTVISLMALVSCGGSSFSSKPQEISFHDITLTIPAGYELDESISDNDYVYYKTFDDDGNLQDMIYVFFQQGIKGENILDDKNAEAFCASATGEENMHDYSGYKVVDLDDQLSALYYTFQLDANDTTYNTSALVFSDSESGIYSIYTSSPNDSSEILETVLDSFKYTFEVWKNSYTLKLQVEFEQNLFLDIYDVEVYVDKEKLGSVSQGDTLEKDISLREGKHKIIFYKSGNHDVSGKTEIDMTEDKIFTCSIKSHSEDIDINNQTEESLADYNDRIEKEKEEAEKKAEEEKKKKEEEKKKKAEKERKKREAEEKAEEAEEEKLEQFLRQDPYSAMSGIKNLGYTPVFIAANTRDDMTSAIVSEGASNPNGWIIAGIDDVDLKHKTATFIVTSQWMRDNLY